MKRRGYSGPELDNLQKVVGPSHPIRLVAHVSRGPWYGFNGVQALILTDEDLYRVQASAFALRRDRVLERFPRASLSDVRWRERSEKAGRISFAFAGKAKSYASKWAEASEMAQLLQG